EWILRDCGAVACIIETDDNAEILRQIRQSLPALQHVWRLEPAQADSPSDTAPSDGTAPPEVATESAIAVLTAAGSATDPAALNTEIEQRRQALRADDVATIIYTSGTTGTPKGCRMLHRNFLFGVSNGMTVLREMFNPAASTLLFLPLAHVLAREIQCGAVLTRTAMGHSSDTSRLLPDLAELRPTALLAIPRVLERLFNGARQKAVAAGKGRIFDAATATAISYSRACDTGHPGAVLRAKHTLFDVLVYRKLRAALGGRCEQAISGGAPLGARLSHFFRGAGITIYEGYGLTETTAACTVNTPAHNRIGTVGRPLPGVCIRIADDGEIMVRGDLVFDGYWNNDTATAEAFDADGWLRTGDLGSLDDDGYLSVTGRKKEIIVTSAGKNVAPAPLEDALRAHPLISQCMVVGDNRPFIGCLITIDPQMLVAWQQSRGKPPTDTVEQLRHDEELRASIAEAVETANEGVSRAEAIKVFRILPQDFSVETGELTPTLKVKRALIADRYAQEISKIYG
ncbi:MAG: AMP-dependent synthetase/ligase, partial [Mycobacteriales bacterium]